MTDLKDRLLDAALIHVPFDGWSDATFRAAAADLDVPLAEARAACPRRGLDLAIAFHKRGDASMLARMRASDMGGMRFRDRVAAAVRHRLEAVEDKEAVRRGATLFALPQNAALGAQLIWGTADAIWTELGDTSEDINWYSKRALLSGVYSATVLFWLGDTSPGHTATWDFLDRRIGDVMQIEGVKATIAKSPVLSRLMAGPNWLGSRIRKPRATRRDDLPGSWAAPRR